MNEDKLQKGIDNIKSIKLSEEENTLMFRNISAHLDDVSKNVVKISSPYFNIFSYSFSRQFVMASIFVLIFGTIGGITVSASEKSVPGDLLYPIKVNITEPAVGAMIFDKVAKIDWEVEKADRRLREAEVLVKQGRLDSELRKEIETNFSKNTEKFHELANQEDNRIKTEAKSSNADIEKINNTRANFENNAAKHAERLEKMKEELSDDKKMEVESLKNVVLEKSRNRKRQENKVENQDESNNQQETTQGDAGNN